MNTKLCYSAANKLRYSRFTMVSITAFTNVVRSWSLRFWNLQTRFHDPELEDEFLSTYADSTLRWTWHACSSSVWWVIVRFVSMHLQIYNARVYHLCCKKIYGTNTRSEFVMWKYWSTAIELMSPLNGFIMLWTKERMQGYNLLLSLPFYASIFPSGGLLPKLKKCSAGSMPYKAVAYAIFEEQLHMQYSKCYFSCLQSFAL
jgi:hypothetical protein